MKTTLLSGLTIVLFLVLQQMPSPVATLSPLMTASGVQDSDKSGYYIVVLRDDTTHDMFQDIISRVLPVSMDVQLHGSVEGLVKAFTVKLSDEALQVVSILYFALLSLLTYFHFVQVDKNVSNFCAIGTLYGYTWSMIASERK